MAPFDQYDPDEPVQYKVNLDIPAFIRGAVKDKMSRDAIALYLFMVSQTYQATDKMRQFFPVVQEHDLSRNES